LRVKICGITNIQDALDAIEAGVDALGFVFYEKSPRYIDPTEAKKIIDQIPPFVQTVGLFVNMHAAQIDFICKRSTVDTAQIIQENADEKFYKSLQIRHIDVVRVQSKDDLVSLEKNRYYLVDAFVEGYGGAGKRIALEWFDDIDCSHLILAGGLKPENLKELKGYNFYAVDVSSGVEASKGKKDKQKMVDFINKVNEIS
jgi:phosphoribosylanthranilate isomerase